MNIANESIIDYYSTNVNEFKCGICALTFRTTYERNMHILDHLEKSFCTICHETLVQIGNVWYSPHKHSEQECTPTTRGADTDGYGTETFDPLTTKIESNSVCDEEFLDKNKIEYSTAAEIKSEEVADIHTEAIKTKKSEASETIRKNKRSKSPKSIVTGIKRQKRSSTSTQKRWKCKLCNGEFLFEANLIEHQDEHEKSSTQRDDDVHDTQFIAVSSMEDAELTNDFNAEITIQKCDEVVTGKNDSPQKIQKSKRTDVSVVDEDDYVDILAYDDIKNLTEEQLNNLECPICDRHISSQSGLKNHLRVHQTVYSCKLCKSLHPTTEKYRSHIASVHDVITKKSRVKAATSNTSTNNSYTDADAIDWICEYCNRDFDSELNLARHLVKEHGADKTEHMCKICMEEFTELNDLLTHMRGHSESTQHKCSIDGCNHGFASKASVVIHLNKHKNINSDTILRKTQDDLSETAKQYAVISNESCHLNDYTDKKPMKCNMCAKELISRAKLLVHIQTMHMNQGNRCSNGNCNKTFRTVTSLRRHLKIHHPEVVYRCDICEKIMYSMAKFSEHQLLHGQPESGEGSFACDICSKTCKTKRALRLHFNKHEKTIGCTLCDEKFSTIKVMMAHRERHGKKPTLTCRYQNCNQVFEDRREFMKHASEHPVTGKKRFICPHCGKSISRTYIKDHINTHTKAVSHECSYCQKSFIKKSTLWRHLLIHTNKKPYVCDVDGCSQAYRDSIDLKRHKFSAHKIYTKKHICSICSQVFPERKLLTKHTINVHDKIDITNPMHSN